MELAEPTPAADEPLVAVAAAGVDYPDVLVIADKYQFKPDPPSRRQRDRRHGGASARGWPSGNRAIAWSAPCWGAAV